VTLDSVIAAGRIVYIKKNCCLAEGGETRDVTDSVHQEVSKICVAASKIVGKQLAGVDVICDDVAKKPTQKHFSILEINGKPDLYMHNRPTSGKSRNAVKKVIEFMVKAAI